MLSTQFDQAKAEDFAGKMFDIINGSSLGFLVAIGHLTGLFDAMAELPASTSVEVADAAGLEERYVREWLGGMVVGRIVEYEADAGTYGLPAEHAAFLTRSAGADNIAVFTQYFPLIGKVTDEVIRAFREGGGVPYSSFENFQALQAAETGPVFDAHLLDEILPLAEGLVARLESGINVLEFGSGSGHALNLMAKAFPKSRFTGMDLSDEGNALARSEADELGLTNVSFETGDAGAITGTYELITTFDTVHDLAQPAYVLQTIFAVLRADGVFLMGDIAASSRLEENVGHVLGPTLYAFSVFHCMTVSLAQGGVGLGTVWGIEVATRMLEDAGFASVEVNRTEDDPLHVFYACRKQPASV